MPVPQDYKPTDTKPESKYIRAEDFPLNWRAKVKVADVNVEEMPARDGKPPRKRLILSFVGKVKGFALNATNQGFIEAHFGLNPNDWIASEITLHRTVTTYEGKTVPALRVIEASKGTPPPPREPGADDGEAGF